MYLQLKKQRLRLQVFAMEVQSSGQTLADKIMLKRVGYPDDYISHELRFTNPAVFSHAVALVAQKWL